MAWKIVSLFGIALLALSEAHPPISEQRVKIESVGKKSEHHEAYAWTYPSYEFSYEVSDPHTHDFKGQHETRNGDEVKGYYWLIQPDGLKRTVKYHADKNSGIKTHVDFTKPNHLPSNEKSKEEANNSKENEANQEENLNQENTSSNENEENSEINQESTGENESNDNNETSNNESEAENTDNENNNAGNSEGEGENQEQEEGINISELEEISRVYNEGKNRGRINMGYRYKGRHNKNEGNEDSQNQNGGQRGRGENKYHYQVYLRKGNQGESDNNADSQSHSKDRGPIKYGQRTQGLNRREDRRGEESGREDNSDREGLKQYMWKRLEGAYIWGQKHRSEEPKQKEGNEQNQKNGENEEATGNQEEGEGNNEEESNNGENAEQGEQENDNRNGNEGGNNNEEGNEGENQVGESGGNEQNGENENGNEESGLNSENSDVKRKKHEYHIIIHHPKYIPKSKKSKRRI